MSILPQHLAALLLVAFSLPTWADSAPGNATDQAPAQAKEKPAAEPTPAAPAAPAGDKSAVEPAPAPAPAPKVAEEKPAPVRQRLAKQIAESYQRLKELRGTLADLELAVSSGDADKAWEHAAQLAILWEALDSKQRISVERRFPGTKARVEKALAEGNALARTAAPRTPVATKEKKEVIKPGEETTLAKKFEEKKPVDVEAAPKE